MAASTIRLHDMTPSLTPPPSDRGECDDTAMLNTEAFLPDVSFYPSPAPSYTQQRASFSPHSPDLEHHRNSVCEVEEDGPQLFFGVDASTSQMYPAVATSQSINMYPTTVSQYPPFEQTSWMQYNAFSNQNPLYPYQPEDPSTVFGTYVSQAPTIIPPTPQTLTGGSFNFNEPIRHQDQAAYLASYPQPQQRHHSPSALSTTSASNISSRSGSPNLPHSVSSSAGRSMRCNISAARSSTSSLHAYGIPIRTPGSTTVQAWRCAYPNCTSRAVFTRGCDLRKHYNRHSKHLFCRIDGCPQSEAACIATAQQQAAQSGGEPSDPSKLIVTGGFSSKKDRARHEAKHNPNIKCDWRGPNGEECGRLFSRMDNMKDHMRRIHHKGQNPPQQQALQNKSKTR